MSFTRTVTVGVLSLGLVLTAVDFVNSAAHAGTSHNGQGTQGMGPQGLHPQGCPG